MKCNRSGWLLAVLLLAACTDDPVTPETPALFARYVSLGNSITAGFQSGGINDSTQRRAYPRQLALKANAEFGFPALARPGCPPPLVDAFTQERLDGPLCSFRRFPRPARLDNLAVPGATIADLLGRDREGARPNFLTSLMLDDLDPIEWLEQEPATLVSIWIGNNDVLAAALSGELDRLTPLPRFEADLAELAQRVAATAPLDVILIGVVDPLVAPALQPGAFYWGVTQLAAPPVELAADSTCAPGGAGWANLVSLFAVAYSPVWPPHIRCDAGAPYVLDPAAQAAISQRVAAFNAALSATAAAYGWLWLDPAELLAPLLADPAQIRKCQGLLEATTPAAFSAALTGACPSDTTPHPFGRIISLDGIHPSTDGHLLVARELAARLNARHGLRLPLD
jgi:hypothetical protein